MLGNAPINVNPERGMGRATHENLTVSCIPRVVDTRHMQLHLSITNSRREVNHDTFDNYFLYRGGDFDNLL